MAVEKEIPPHLRGVYVQVYRDKLPGRTHAARVANLVSRMRGWRDAGVRGGAMHGFTIEHGGENPTGLAEAMPELAGLCGQLGLRCFAAFGLNSDDAARKGEHILRTARVPGVDGVGIDAEGRFEDETKILEAEHARVLGRPLIDAPDRFVVVHQPWPIPQVHAGKYPWLEFAKYATAWANQDYYDAWTAGHGVRRYTDLEPVFEKDWHDFVRLHPELGAAERISTITGYHWNDIPHHATRAVLRYETQWIWSEPFPEAPMIHSLLARRLLGELGCLTDQSGRWLGTPDWSAGRRGAQACVAKFQAMWNRSVPKAKRLEEDGLYGPKTDAALFSIPSTAEFSAADAGREASAPARARHAASRAAARRRSPPTPAPGATGKAKLPRRRGKP